MSSNHFYSDLPVFLFFIICFILLIQFFQKFFTYVQKKLGRIKTNSPSLQTLNQFKYDQLYVLKDLPSYDYSIWILRFQKVRLDNLLNSFFCGAEQKLGIIKDFQNFQWALSLNIYECPAGQWFRLSRKPPVGFLKGLYPMDKRLCRRCQGKPTINIHHGAVGAQTGCLPVVDAHFPKWVFIGLITWTVATAVAL